MDPEQAIPSQKETAVTLPGDVVQLNGAQQKRRCCWLVTVVLLGLAVVAAVVVVIAMVVTDSDSGSTADEIVVTVESGDHEPPDSQQPEVPKASSSTFTGTKAVHYSVSLQSWSPDGSCTTSDILPVVTWMAVCPVGGVSATPGCRTLADYRTISCESVTGAVHIQCYATDTDTSALLPQLQVRSTNDDETVFSCSKKTGFYSGTDSYGYTFTQTSYAGSAEHVIQVHSARSGELIDQASTTSTCTTSFRQGMFDSGSKTCKVGVSPVAINTATSSTSTGLDSALLEPFDTAIETDKDCDYNVECASDACIAGICAATKLTDNSLGCDDDFDCFSGGCARLSMDETEAGCCGSGDSLLADDNSRVCTEQPTNSTCFTDGLCTSGVCLFGTCMEGQLEEFWYCEHGPHCLSGACALTAFEDKLCCPTAETVEKDDEQYCAKLEVDYMCSFDEMCDSGACGLNKHTTDAERVCCASGSTVRVIMAGDSFLDSYCTELSAGTPCGDDDMCAPGTSGGKACARDAYEAGSPLVCCATGAKAKAYEPGNHPFRKDYCAALPTGSACGENEMCESLVCVDGICQESIKQDWEECDDGDDCVSGGCGLAEHVEDAKRVCCPGGRTVRTNKPGSAWSDDYCTNLPAGTPCGIDGMCALGSTGGKACARASYTAGAPIVCCSTGTKAEAYEPGNYPWRRDYCASLLSGSACGENEMCASGTCLDGSCQ